MKNLFIVFPNCSGSSLLHNCLIKCKNTAFLHVNGAIKEGHFFFRSFREGKFIRVGPHPNEFKTHLWFSDADILENENNYRWDVIKKTWNSVWGDASNKVLIEKSTTNVSRVHMLAKHFPNSYFIFGLRNPYAVIESIDRRHDVDVVEEAADHWLYCANKQKHNIENYIGIYFSYEDMCGNPKGISREIANYCKELYDINISNFYTVRDGPSTLINLNEKQINRLTPSQKQRINRILSNDRDILDYFNYSLI